MASSKMDCLIKGRHHSLDTSCKPDFCIKLRTGSLPVHKELLISASHYFGCLFNSGMKEVHRQTLNLESLNPKVVKAIIAYMYGENIIIEWEDITDYLDIVECWQIPDIKDELEEYIVGNIDVDNCNNWSLLAQIYHMKKVQALVYKLLCSNFASVVTQSDFLSVDVSVVMDLLTNDIMLDVSSDDKLQACINWMFAREADRKDYYKDLLNYSGIMKCSSKFIQLVAQSYAKKLSVEDFLSVEPYLSKLLAWTSAPKRDKEQKMVVLGNNIGRPTSKSILQFDFDKNTITKTSSLPDVFTRSSQTRCSTPYGMFSCRLGSKSVTCAQLDVPSMAFLHLPCLPEAESRVFHTSAVFCNDKVYVLMGLFEQTLMYQLDMQMLKWSLCATLPQTSPHPVVLCSINTMIYAFVQFELFIYSTTDDLWYVNKGVPYMCLKDKVMCAVPDGSDIYVMITGAVRTRCVRYDSVTKQWTNLSDCASRYVPYTAVLMDKRIIITSRG